MKSEIIQILLVSFLTGCILCSEPRPQTNELEPDEDEGNALERDDNNALVGNLLHTLIHFHRR